MHFSIRIRNFRRVLNTASETIVGENCQPVVGWKFHTVTDGGEDMSQKEMLTLDAFEEASELVRKVTNDTSLVYSEYFSSQCGNKVWLKPENMQVTGAYKIRGAYYKISTMSDEARAKGLITASAGNHAQGVAYAAKAYGCKAVIVMPTTTPLIKVERTRSYGAEVLLWGDVFDESQAKALELAQEKGYTYIPPFDDLTVATGQGTIMMEIFKELPLVDIVLVPVGGGGLATGVSTLAKLLNPKIRVIMMTSMPEVSFLRKAKESGCDGFWYKEESQLSLVEACDLVMAGEFPWPKETPPVMIRLARSDEFTDRELDVIRELALGRRYEEIAASLYVSTNTVKYHIKNVLQKTGFHSAIQLVAEVVEKRLVLPKY